MCGSGEPVPPDAKARHGSLYVRGAGRWPVLALGAAALAGGCSGSSEQEPPGTEGDRGAPGAATADFEATPGTIYQRTIAFIETSGDSALLVPWDFENRIEADGTQRAIRGWLGRAGQWRLFMEDDWVTGPTRAPWRIVPRGQARLVVGHQDVLEEIYYREGVRDLSLRLGETVVEWNGQRGATYRLLEGSVRLGDVETRGLVLDAFAVRTSGAGESAELALLIGGDRFQLVLANLEGPGRYRAWARQDTLELFWPEVEVEWGETRSFERARRDVPVVWRIESGDGRLSGEFESVTSHLQTQNGDGAILPVLGVYEVAGLFRVDGEEVAVRGFLRHFQR